LLQQHELVITIY